MVRTTRQDPTPKLSPEPNPDIAAIITQQLQNILPQIVTQVNANVNNPNGGDENGRNNRCSYKTFAACNHKEFNRKGGAVALTRWIEKMESVFDNCGCIMNQRLRYAASCFVNKALTWWNTQVQARGQEAAIENEFWNHFMVGANHVAYTDKFHELAKLVPHLLTPESSRIKSAILTAGILTDEAVCYGTLTKGNDKRKKMEELSKQGSTWEDNKKAKIGSGFVGTVPPKNDDVNTYPKCAKCYSFHPENAPYEGRACSSLEVSVGVTEKRETMERKEDGSLYFMDRIWVPLAGDVRRVILNKAYKSRYYVHRGADKMYHNLRDMYWWPGIKRDIAIYKVLGTRLDLSTAYHPQTDGQSERIIQTLEDMLRAYVIDFGGRSPVLWEEIGEGSLIGPELVLETTDKVVLIKEKLKVVRDRQNNYTEKRHKPLEFEVGNQVLLKVSPWKGVVRFGKKGGLDMSMISLKVFDHLILSAFVSGDEYSICSRLVIMERNDVLHAMLLQ
uniref:Integrase zinc-binding domain-containing protein n=1 Tax=Tanacetum cinerariifolium TaxID=118510 RepID=A0A6L2MCQ9_TANCI|nr:hypothetical protein [Tanacetum cinerariifolium]